MDDEEAEAFRAISEFNELILEMIEKFGWEKAGAMICVTAHEAMSNYDSAT